MENPSKQTSGLVVILGCFLQAKSFLATRSALLPSLSCFNQRTPLSERIPSPPNLPCFPVFLSKPLPALMCTIPPLRHPHPRLPPLRHPRPPPWASRALGHLSMQLLHGRKGVPPHLKKMNGKFPPPPPPGWSQTNDLGLLRGLQYHSKIKLKRCSNS